MNTALLTPEECAEQARCSARTIRREIADRKLPVTWHDGKQHIAVKDWEEYLAKGGSVRTDLAPQDDFASRISPALEPSARTPLYNGCAVYFLFHAGELVYIGQTTALLARLATHTKEKQFDTFSFIRCHRNELMRIERWAIVKHRPKLNLV